MSIKASIKPNIIIIGRVERETVGVKSNHKDVVAYARGLIDKHFVAKEESFYTVRTYGDFYYYEIHEGGEGKAYLPSVMKAVESIEKKRSKLSQELLVSDDKKKDDVTDVSVDSGSGFAKRIKDMFKIRPKDEVHGASELEVLSDEESDVISDTFYIKGAIKCSKIKFNGNNMIFSFTSESENTNIKTTNGIVPSIPMTPYFSDLGNIKVSMCFFLALSILAFLSAVVFRELGFRERVFYVKGEQVMNVPQLIEKTVRGAGVASDEYVEKVVFSDGRWIVKKKKIKQEKKPEMLDEMLENKDLLEDGVNAVKTKTLR